ncbi:hypothetical protein PFAG_03160 [Plasmodium falciparum Santa Lucia]|uniref:Uncharacterized protein n=10 Tax=Plasmodium falciparum TaxID=5833 RepID=Q8IIT4_PLAF7|nr:conserved Plasmodium protein, unknown function [Plasmodium falciparum 3D7]ETW17942.1 hypothetical protein PFFVO_03169 [Plasmodium falciparum Vietnam Oak-Knoll (FVO)]ETW36111.1 hypothetical protein PFTANZ_03204 [Plasmodium falciparum Tanzania (2000708)]ETW42307.1 hypothetical protein PFNF135_03317 [Plasmodium falciparum NF135/5.C10]ETW52691.1 hypothetical protein PFUGPA_04998 [Plasmodium falciparum Palo Alto/Uganda]ETW60902.1 hypothetical protein PFMC_03133 [Plasmodium falciparum CAMP/Malays|eukprot:XP_001347756.1 conserved Plasmodium protein, unknown function [Plasmodium falciparum 3D7]
MSEFYENDEDVLQMIQHIKKITKESKRKYELDIDTLVEDTKTNLINNVNDEKDNMKQEIDEKIKKLKQEITKHEKNIKEKNKLYQKLKRELANAVNNYKNKIKEFYLQTENFMKTYENEKKELDELEDKEWKDLNIQCIEILNNTKSNIYATKDETSEKLRKVLKSIL